MTMPAEQDALVRRVRDAWADQPGVREVSMFGGRSFMIDDAMVVAVRRDGGLLVRVEPSRSAQLRRRPGAGQAEMGAGRSMGPGWIEVQPHGLAGADLAFWLDVARQRPRTGAASARSAQGDPVSPSPESPS